jgi:hypothetical protein
LFSRRSFVAAGLLAPLARPAAAEARYPAHSVTLVNPFAAGGQSDPIGRIVTAHFQNALGQLAGACEIKRGRKLIMSSAPSPRAKPSRAMRYRALLPGSVAKW